MLISYRDSRNNDIYVYFEEDEMKKIKEGKIEGYHVNDGGSLGKLEATIDWEACRKSMELVHLDITGALDGSGEVYCMSISMSEVAHYKLETHGSFGDHQGYRHVNLLDVAKLDLIERGQFEQLKSRIIKE